MVQQFAGTSGSASAFGGTAATANGGLSRDTVGGGASGVFAGFGAQTSHATNLGNNAAANFSGTASTNLDGFGNTQHERASSSSSAPQHKRPDPNLNATSKVDLRGARDTIGNPGTAPGPAGGLPNLRKAPPQGAGFPTIHKSVRRGGDGSRPAGKGDSMTFNDAEKRFHLRYYNPDMRWDPLVKELAPLMKKKFGGKYPH